MKQKIHNILHKPKVAIGSAAVLAVVVGIGGYVYHQRNLAKTFAQIDATVATTSVVDTNQQDITLSFPVGGRVQTVSVKIGDRVSTGQVLATVDQGSAQASLQSAEGTLAQAKANYNKILAAATPQDVAVSQAAEVAAETTLQNNEQNLLNELKTAESNTNTIILSTTNILFSNPQSASPQFSVGGTLQTDQHMVGVINDERVALNGFTPQWQTETSNISADTVDQTITDSLDHLSLVSNYFTDILNVLTNSTQTNSSTGGASLAGAETAVANAKATIDGLSTTIINDEQAVQSAQSAHDVALAQLSLKQSPARSEDVAIANAQILSAQGLITAAETMVNNTVLRAPIAGVITHIDIAVGEQAQPLKEVMILQQGSTQ